MESHHKQAIERIKETNAENARKRAWTIGDGNTRKPIPMRYDMLDVIEKDERGEPLSRNERRMLAALDKRIAKDEANRKAE